MYEVEIWTVIPGLEHEGEIHMMSQTSIKTYRSEEHTSELQSH